MKEQREESRLLFRVNGVGVGGGWGRDWFLATEWVQLKYNDIGPKTSNQIPEEPPNMLALSFSHLCILICYFFWQQLEV